MPKILVADDNTNIQKMVSLSFEERGIQVVAVGNGEAAVRRMPDVNPDLVLADIFMPVRNGYEVCEFVKKDERFSHVPVILLVGAFDPLDEKEARRVGADGVLKKPFVPPDPLIAMVTSALEKNPRIAAEIARSKEPKAPQPLPEPVHIPEPATSAHAEVKPLPEFPEPTSLEEQALVYGFGSSRRVIDDAQIDTADEPAAPVSEDGEETDQEFDGAATSRDWRRNAMDFDVPADVANQPAFAQDSDLDSAMFPSEHDVPPRKVRIPESIEEPRASRQNLAPARAETQPAIQPLPEGAEVEFFATADASAVDESVSKNSPARDVESVPQPSSQPEPAHRMGKMAPGPSEHSSKDWMAARPQQSAPVSTATPTSPTAPLKAAESQPELRSKSKLPGLVAPASSPQETADDSFFAEEPAPSVPSTSWLPSAGPLEEAREAVIETTSSDPLPIAHASSESGLEADSDSEPPVALKDPDLFEPPAVHAAPEPLLEEDEPPEPSHYGSATQELQPLHTFLVPEAESPMLEERAAREIAPSAQHEPAAVSDRIPTAPPPNLEALSSIPFLTPPAEFHASVNEPAAPNPDTVNAVVQKVLEKLEPQLHDLLSQGVLKPLVESILKKDLSKKEQ